MLYHLICLQKTNRSSANTTTGTTISVAFEMAVSGVSSTPTHDFMSRLSTYAAAQITLFVNLKKLHSLQARYKLQETSPVSRIRVPYILMRLSDLLPSKNRSPRTKKPWAKDSVKVVFQSLEPGVPEEFFPFVHRASPLQPLGVAKAKAKGGNTPAATPPAVVQQQIVQLSPNDAPKQLCPGETAVIMTEARMTVPVPQALAALKERVDRDIAFDAKSGGFAFQLKSKIGESIIPAFIERAIRVERLVDFIEVLHKHERILKCEHISLGRIIFTYGNAHPPNNALDVDGIDCYEATIDFGSTDSNMTLTLNQGNPHVRIVDNLTKVLNEGEGLEGVVTLLPLTLPALRALDTLEGAWALLSAKGEALVFVRAVEWFVIRYTVFSSTPRKVIFEIKLRQRKGEPWWHIKRIDSRDREGDDIDASLKPVWNSNGIGWQGMRIDAVAQPAGMEDLIGKLDEVMRSVASNVEQAAPTPAPVVGQAKPQQRAPEAPMMGQQLTQQPTPSHSQSQSQVRNTPSQSQGRGTPQNQGRNTPHQSQGQSQGQKQRQQEREIVEID
jgi:mediator of RNA polymerase II transcription subunit 14